MQLKVKLARLSLCHCNHRLLRDNIKLGQQYVIDTDSISLTEPFVLRCGGCGCETQLFGSVMANCITNPTAPFAKMPFVMFDVGVKGAG